MIEQNTRHTIDNILTNKGWILDISNPNKNVYFERDIIRITECKELRESGKSPDYVLIDGNKTPIAIIEAKAGNKDLNKAIEQATEYAKILNAPLIFVMNNNYCITKYLFRDKPLYINEKEVTELITPKEAMIFIQENTNEIYTIAKEIILSRHELINIFKNMNNTLRCEGLRAGIERLNEFANVLFMKLYCDYKEDNIWNNLKNTSNAFLIETFNSAISKIEKRYGVEVFTSLQIKKPETLMEIISKLDKLKLSSIDTDIKGDAFEYFLQKATATENDLGEYFTPRHIIRTIIHLLNPRFNETIYDPFCGTGGFLTEAYNHIKNNIVLNTDEEKEILREKTVFGREITTNARLGKMNMILHGDGHSGVEQINSLENPITHKYDIVVTNMPFAQKMNTVSSYYYNGIAKNSGDGVCLLHCFQAVKQGGRMAVVIPEGVLFRNNLKEVRRTLLEHARLELIISLPQGTFLPYTGVKTNILYFTDCHTCRTENSIWYYEVKNDGYTLDNHRRKLIGTNDIEKLEFSGLKYMNKRYDQNEEGLLRIGFEKILLEKIVTNEYCLTGSIYRELKKSVRWNTVSLYSVLGTIESGSRPVGGVSGIEDGAISIGGEHIGLNGRLDMSKIRFVPIEFYINASKGFVCDQDILLCKDGALTGKACIVDIGLLPKKETMINEHVYILRTDSSIIDQYYLFYYLRSEYVQKQIKNLAFNKSAQPGLNINHIKSIQIPLPPIQEQKRIVCEIKNIHSRINDAEDIIKKSNDKIEHILDSLYE